MKTLDIVSLEKIEGGASPCAEALAGSIVVTLFAIAIVTEGLAIAAGVATARSIATCISTNFK